MLFLLGMSSGVAMKKHAGGVAEYRSSEGKAVTLPYRGMIKDTINDILGEYIYYIHYVLRTLWHDTFVVLYCVVLCCVV